MSSLRWNAKTDANQPDIIAALETIGATVQPLRDGEGTPDLLVGFRGNNFLLEVKTDDGTLNRKQEKWHRTWRGRVAVVRSPEEACRVVTHG